MFNIWLNFGNTAVAKPTLCFFAASFCFLPSLVLFAQFSSVFLLPFFTLVFFGFLLLSRSVFTTINSFVLKTCLYLFPAIHCLSRLVNHFFFLPIRINKFPTVFLNSISYKLTRCRLREIGFPQQAEKKHPILSKKTKDRQILTPCEFLKVFWVFSDLVLLSHQTVYKTIYFQDVQSFQRSDSKSFRVSSSFKWSVWNPGMLLLCSQQNHTQSNFW